VAQLNCEEIRGLLVDYSDGQLLSDESAKVRMHLAECERCRAVLAALNDSLRLAEVVWQDNATESAEIGNVAEVTEVKPNKLPLRHIGAIAAGVIVLLAVTVVFQFNKKAAQPANEEMTIAQLEYKMERAGHAAQLLAAADILAEQPGGTEFAREQYAYVAETYPDMQAATLAKSRMDSIPERRTEQ